MATTRAGSTVNLAITITRDGTGLCDLLESTRKQVCIVVIALGRIDSDAGSGCVVCCW